MYEFNSLSDEEVIKELNDYGIKVIYKPIALVPNTLESHNGMDQHDINVVDMDIHEAYNKLVIRSKVMKDPFS